ncbi:sensor histidine kinase [Cribrihabitans neustonicus]|uniref:sensor histidine kinase n=1 Tax=Cribrihabitans neustonicus TaxID=1429085 RepID=UPI003B590B5F
MSPPKALPTLEAIGTESKMTLGSTVVIFAIATIFDLMTPLGVAGGIAHVFFVLCGMWWRPAYVTFVFAAIATTLTVLAYLVITEITASLSAVVVNRALSLAAIWVVAFMVYFNLKKTALAIQGNEARLDAVVAGSVDGIIIIDEHGTIESFNPACEELFGFSAEEVLGQHVSMLVPVPYRQQSAEYLRRYQEAHDVSVIDGNREMVGLRKDGSTFPFERSLGETRVGGKTLLTLIIRDITDRKKAEEEREIYIERLARSNQELDQFAYVASHDLKAPLRVIDNASRWLEEDLEGKLDEESLENMALLRNRVERMEKLLDDLLEYSRIGRQTDDRYTTRTSGAELMKDVLLLVEKPERFEIKVSPEFSRIALNAMPVQQIFVNLINNSIKHHDKDTGRIEIGVEDRGEKYLFSVRDDGPGIAPRFHDQIFKMFQTLKPRDRVEGSGMGLAIIHKHVQHFGEAISVDSAEGQGAEFRFTWPKHQRLN